MKYSNFFALSTYKVTYCCCLSMNVLLVVGAKITPAALQGISLSDLGSDCLSDAAVFQMINDLLRRIFIIVACFSARDTGPFLMFVVCKGREK